MATLATWVFLGPSQFPFAHGADDVPMMVTCEIPYNPVVGQWNDPAWNLAVCVEAEAGVAMTAERPSTSARLAIIFMKRFT